jgi:DNA sulfur modification protein DndC
MTAQPTLWEGKRQTIQEAIDYTAVSLNSFGPAHDTWAIAWSGGKDSTAVLCITLHLLATGQVDWPKKLIVFYADTRMELPPLSIAATATMQHIRDQYPQIDMRTVMAPMDARFFVYMFGRGVPPASNIFRWCTPKLKIEPMQVAMQELLAKEDNALMLTGVRIGESAQRDAKISLACGKDGGECGQGWYQQVLPNAKGIRGKLATLAPILHWRVCHVWEWLRFWAPHQDFGGFTQTKIMADAYGGEENAEDINARTGCIGCPLASEDRALNAVIKIPGWEYLAPLKQLKPLYREIKLPQHRIRKDGHETKKDGSLVKNPGRMGPLKMASRRYAMNRVLEIQRQVNDAAKAKGRPTIDILNDAEVLRINQLIDSNTWPHGWDGTEQGAEIPTPHYFPGGVVQELLI